MHEVHRFLSAEEALVHSLLEALDSDRHYIIIGDLDKNKLIITKTIPAEDVMTHLQEAVYQTD